MKVFITGGTTGIGAALALHYLKANHSVGICGRDLNKTEEGLKNFEKCFLYEADVTTSSLNTAIKEFAGEDGIDIVIANAGISVGSKSRNVDLSKAYSIIDTNVTGLIKTFELALEVMRKHGKGGQLVAIASVAGFLGLPGAAPYSASKAAVLSLCESLAIDLKYENIFVTSIAPGFIDTPLTRKNNHPMPFLMPASKAAEKIVKAIAKRKTLYVFPWQMWFLIFIVSRLPKTFYHFLMSRAPLGYGKEEK